MNILSPEAHSTVISDQKDFNFKLKRVKNGIDLINSYLKKIGFWCLILFLPFFFILIIFLALIIAVEHWFQPHSANHFLTFFGMSANQVGGAANSFIDDVLKAIEAVIYVVFIKPVLWLLQQFQTVINFIGGGSLSNRILFNNNGQKWGVPNEYWIMLLIAVGLLFIFIGIKLLFIISEQQNRKGAMFRRSVRSLFLVVIGLAMLPAIFFFANTLINLVTRIILKGSHTSGNIGLVIFNSSFNNGIQHFTSVPDSFNFADSSHFNYLICLFSEGFMVYVFLLIVLNLITRVFELFLFYCVGPLVFTSTVADTSGSYAYFRNWTTLVTQRFLAFTFIFLAYNIFINAITVFSVAATIFPNTITRPIFVLLGIFSAGVVCVKAPTLLSAIIGSQTSLIDSLGHLMTLNTTANAAKAGYAWTVSALIGSKQSRQNRAQLSNSNNFLKTSGGALGMARGATNLAATGVGLAFNPRKFIEYTGAGLVSAAAGIGAYYNHHYHRLHKKEANPEATTPRQFNKQGIKAAEKQRKINRSAGRRSKNK